jgi:plastocyanin
MLRKTKVLVATMAVCSLALVACSEGTTPSNSAVGGARVDAVNIAFKPATLRVSSGTEVTWTNLDQGVRHTATSGLKGEAGVPGVSQGEAPRPDGTFDGDLPDASAEFSFTFEEAGTHAYFCRVHPSMTGEIIVD